MLNFQRSIAALTFAVVLASCGGGDDIRPTASSGNSGNPSPVPTYGTGKFKDNVRYITRATGASFASPTQLVIPGIITINIGDVLILDDVDRLVRVIGIANIGSQGIYTVENAALTDAYSELNISFNGVITSTEIGQQFDENDSEIEMLWISTPAKSLNLPSMTRPLAVDTDLNTLQIKFKQAGLSTGSGIEIDGDASFQLNPNFDFNLGLKYGQSLPSLEMHASLAPALRVSLTTTSKSGSQLSYNLEKTWNLRPIIRTILVPISGVPVPVPVIIKPIIVAAANVSGTTHTEASTHQTFSADGSLGFSKTDTGGFSHTSSLTTESTAAVSGVTGELALEIQAPKLEIRFLLYGTAGPFFEIFGSGNVAGTAGLDASTPPRSGVDVVARGGATANLGLKAGFDFGQIPGVAGFFKDVSVEYTPVSVQVYNESMELFEQFFPYPSSLPTLPTLPTLYPFPSLLPVVLAGEIAVDDKCQQSVHSQVIITESGAVVGSGCFSGIAFPAETSSYTFHQAGSSPYEVVKAGLILTLGGNESSAVAIVNSLDPAGRNGITGGYSTTKVNSITIDTKSRALEILSVALAGC